MPEVTEIRRQVGSLVSGRTHEPPVELPIGDRKPEQLPPAKAREIAVMLIEAAEAAEQDAFLFSWAREKLDCDDGQAARLVGELRAWREKREAGDEH
ncbi:MAG TPA: hypothetical protein VFL91_29815 [Thermomicrobiales bacterium]|nr:hypothetical protein [Thermomicrobiales bacterium]